MIATTLDTQTKLIAEQIRLETETRTAGIEKFHRAQECDKTNSHETGSAAVRDILIKSLEHLKQAIIVTCDKNAAHRHGIAVKHIKHLNPEILALITLRAILDGIHTERSLTTLALTIGKKVEDESHFNQIPKDTLKKIYKAVKYQSGYINKRHAAQGVLDTDNDKWKEWDNADLIHIGTWLIDRAIGTTGIITTKHKKENKNNSLLIIPTASTLQRIDQINTQIADLYPDYNPMVIPPKPWENLTTGGYHTPNIPQMPFVKTRWAEHKNILTTPRIQQQMQPVYDGVNAIQNTAWRINTTVLDCLKHMYLNKITAGDLPYQGLIEPPRCPLCGAVVEYPHPCFETDPEALAEWKTQTKDWHRKKETQKSKINLVARTIATAQKYKNYPAIYFPYNCDFRGRIYAIASVLHPQGGDYAKGILEFAQGKKINTQQALDWLKIAGANHYGNKLDKKPYPDRIKWVDDNTQWICHIAQNPLNDLTWANADEPFQFLAWATDYAAYTADPENYQSHAVVAMDGSCNGLQHYSALLRDPIGAAAVNLIPGDKPNDIYADVADKVVAQLQTILNTQQPDSMDAQMSARWFTLGITRKTTKRSVMVVPYGGTHLACREYILEHIQEKFDTLMSQLINQNITNGSPLSYMQIQKQAADQFPFTKDKYKKEGETSQYTFFKAAVWLSKYVWEAIKTTVIGARAAMEAIQNLAKATAHLNHPIQWTAPSGFEIYQNYKDIKSTLLKTKLRDTQIQLRINKELLKTSASQQANAAAPNFIHSMDAAALIKTVNECTKYGITAFAMIHDSYGTHAADAALMAKTLREQFIALYTDTDPLDDLFTHTINTYGDILEQKNVPDITLPPKGDFNLTQIQKSEYFFA